MLANAWFCRCALCLSATGVLSIALTVRARADGDPSSALPAAKMREERKPATESLEGVQNALRTSHQKLQSLWVQYKATNLVRGEVHYGNGSYMLREVAAKGLCRYLRAARVTDRQKAEDDPLASFSYYDGKSWNAYYPYNRLYETSHRFADPTHTLKARADAFLECLAWWPADDDSDPPGLSGHPFFLHQLFAKEPCRILAEQECIDGQWCHTIEVPGLDKLWIDADAGTLVQRIRFDGESQRPLMRYELRDYREVSHGIWLPYQVHRVEYSTVDGSILYDMNYQVASYEVNTVPDSLFTFVPGPGTLVYHRDTDTATQVPGGMDLIDIFAGRVKNLMTLSGSPWSFGLGPWLAAVVFLGGGCGLYFLAKVAGRLLFRRSFLAMREARNPSSGAACEAFAQIGPVAPDGQT